MKRLAPLCLLLILSLAVSASALRAPETVVGNGGCVAIISCDQSTSDIGMNMHSRLQESAIWKAGGLGLRMVPLSEAKGMKDGSIGTMVYATKTQASEFSDDDPFKCKNTVLVELWTPACGQMPRVCTHGNEKNILELPDNPSPDGYNPKKQYFFQDTVAGSSTGIFFKGTGFYMSCGEDTNRGWDGSHLPRERVLIAGGTPMMLKEVAMEFLEELVKKQAEYSPELKYRIKDDWGQSLVVGFEEDKGAVDLLVNQIKGSRGHKPLVVLGNETDKSAKPLDLGRSGGGFLSLPSKMVKSRLYVMASAKTAFDLQRALAPAEPYNLAFQLFKDVNTPDYTDETIVPVRIYGCKDEKGDTFKITDEYIIDEFVPAVKQKDGDLYIGKNGVVCNLGEEEDDGAGAEMLGEDEYEKGSGVYCKWYQSGDVKGNIYQTGVYSKKTLDGGGEVRLMSGLGACSTHEAFHEYKTLDGAYDKSGRQWIPLCNDSKRFPKNQDGEIECPSGGTGIRENPFRKSVFYKWQYCACAMEMPEQELEGPVIIGEPEVAASGTEATVTWRMRGEIKGELSVRYRGSSVYKEADASESGGVWTATLRGLEPDNEYEYWISMMYEYTKPGEGKIAMYTPLPNEAGVTSWKFDTYGGKTDRLMAAIAIISGGLTSDPVEVESGYELKINGTGFRVIPFTITRDGFRDIPMKTVISYTSLGETDTKTSMNGKPVDFELGFGGTLVMESEGYESYSVDMVAPLAGLLVYHPNREDWIETTDTTATISWIISKADAGSTSRIRYAYMPDVGSGREEALKGGLDWKTENAQLANGVWTVRLEGLFPDSEYVFGLDSNAIGYKSMFFPLADENNMGQWTFTTKEGKLMITDGPTITEVGGGEATVEWKTSKEVASMELTHWYANVPSASASNVQAEKVSPESWRARLAGVSPGISYKYTIAGGGSILPVANAKGETSWDLKLRSFELGAAVSTVSDLGESQAVEVQDGYSVTIDGAGFKVYPFSKDPSDPNYREHPDVRVTYMGTADRKESKGGAPVEFSLSKDGMLVVESEGFEPYAIVIRKAESVPASAVEEQAEAIRDGIAWA